MTDIIFWFLILLVFYAYLGYGILLFLIIRIKRIFRKPKLYMHNDLPTVTLMVAAFNEEDYIREKIDNTLSLDYPKGKIKYLFVTDGSSDRTPDIVKQYPEVVLMHHPERRGKIAAVERAMPFVDTDIVIFTDANTFVNKDAVQNIVRHYADPTVGGVAGEKRIKSKNSDEAAGAGEGIYWKYESQLKKWDSELYSVVGAAGELFSIRTSLFRPVPKDSLIEDFYMTLSIAMEGHRIIYEPDAYAEEEPSASVKEELKRKIRIAAGGIQSIVRLVPLLNFFKHGVLSFEYISHRVLRWTLAPLALPFIFILNLLLAIRGDLFFQVIFGAQVGFYLLALIGLLLESRKIKLKIAFVPYYFCIMNYAVYKGFMRYIKGNQSVLWEKAKRRQIEEVST
ncbi:MAG: glycosyltransferase family 2 protein [Cyclobacteriaceae bacterium]|nr:glycosyltransferase family 2 protein [Cyclobacteriaceae bacterium]